MIVFIDVFLFGSADVQRSTFNTQHPTLNSAAPSSTMTARETRRAAAWLQVPEFLLGKRGRCFASVAA
jgi:hypothetical protein